MINLLAIAGAALMAAVIAVMLRRYHAEYGMLILKLLKKEILIKCKKCTRLLTAGDTFLS